MSEKLVADVFGRVLQELRNDWVINIIVALVILTLGFLLKPVRRLILSLFRRLLEMWRASGRIDRALQSVEDKGVWFSRQPKVPEHYHRDLAQSIPILSLAALKGGVGKTTIAANLAAFFALDRNKRVLLVDLDFQGSLSSMLLARIHQSPNGDWSNASLIVGGQVARNQVTALATPVNDLAATRAITAHYDLARMENDQLIRWLLEHTDRDIRYTLADYLLDHSVQSHFDLVVIDAPPRLTAGAIQAFCASTHVLIPTILDRLSSQAVTSFVGQLLDMRTADLCPQLKLLGVVGSMTRFDIGERLESKPDADPEDSLTIAEREGRQALVNALNGLRTDRQLSAAPTRVLPYDTFLFRSTAIAEQAGERVAYPVLEPKEKNMFRRLGREVSRAIFPDEL